MGKLRDDMAVSLREHLIPDTGHPGPATVWLPQVNDVELTREPPRELPRQVDSSKGDCIDVLGIGRNIRGGTRLRGCGFFGPLWPLGNSGRFSPL